MAVDYSRAYCEGFVQRCEDALTPPEFVAFWYYVTFGRLVADDTTHSAAVCLATEWLQMSRWNKQSILYLMISVVDKHATERAHALTVEARVKEPL